MREVVTLFPYLIAIPILSKITGIKPQRLRKMYDQILDNDCIPLTEIPVEQQLSFARDYLLRDRFVDIDLMQCADPGSQFPYLSPGVRLFFNRSNLVRAALSIQAAYAANHTSVRRTLFKD